jgi:hypothetical protein
MDSLFKLWNEILLHNNAFDISVSKCFIDRVRKNISHNDAFALECHFKRFSGNDRDRVSEVFRVHALFLLENPNRKWTDENVNAIRNLLNDNNLNWNGEEVIKSLDLISQSYILNLLSIFLEILDNGFRNELFDNKGKIPKIFLQWLKSPLFSVKNKKLSYKIFSMFQQLERMYQKNNIWQDLANVAIERVKEFSDAQIYAVTKLIVQIKENDVKKLFLDMVKEILDKTVLQTNDLLLSKIFIICDCKGKILVVPNS